MIETTDSQECAPDDEPHHKSQSQPPLPGQFEKLGLKYQQIRDYLNKQVFDYIPLLGLDNWDIDIQYHGERNGDHPNRAADCLARSEYFMASLNFYLPSFIDSWDEERFGYIEYIVAHELCHAVVRVMRGTMDWDANDVRNEEMAVTLMAKAIMRCRYEGRPARK